MLFAHLQPMISLLIFGLEKQQGYK